MTKNWILGLSLALVFPLLAPQSADAGVIPWTYSAIFGPPGSLAQWRAQSLQNRYVAMNLRAQRRALRWSGYGYGYSPTYSVGYGSYTVGYGCTPSCYSCTAPVCATGCSTGACGTGCSTGCCTTTYYAPYVYNSGCCSTCGVSGCTSCTTSGVSSSTSTSSDSSGTPSTFTPSSSEKKPTEVNPYNTNGSGFKPPSKETPDSAKTFDPNNTSYKIQLGEPKKEIKTENHDEEMKKDEEKKEENILLPLPKSIKLKQIVWNDSIRKLSRTPRRARFGLPTVARVIDKPFRPIDLIEQAEIKIASK